MFKKLKFQGLDYKDLDRFDPHDQKRESLHGFYQTFDFLNLVEKWPQIIGPQLAKVTSPLRIKGDGLVIVSMNASYSQNISFLSEEIKQKIFTAFPELRPIIKKLNFVTQEAFFQALQKDQETNSKALPKFHPQDPRYKTLKMEAEKLFGDVQDQELKQTLTSLFLQTR
jgi:hypothetical protein